MGLLKDLQLLDRLVADGKLNPIYLEDELKSLITLIPTSALTQRLYRYSVGKSNLSEEQIKALISDIDVLKAYNLWDVETEQQTLKRCKKSIEDAEAYKLLSASDKAKYDVERLKRVESYKI